MEVELRENSDPLYKPVFRKIEENAVPDSPDQKLLLADTRLGQAWRSLKGSLELGLDVSFLEKGQHLPMQLVDIFVNE